MLALRLPRDVERRLAALARKTGRTKTHCATQAIQDFLEEQERVSLARKAGARTAKGRKDRSPYDTEPLSAEDFREIRKGLAQIRRGDTISHEAYWRKRGL